MCTDIMDGLLRRHEFPTPPRNFTISLNPSQKSWNFTLPYLTILVIIIIETGYFTEVGRENMDSILRRQSFLYHLEITFITSRKIEKNFRPPYLTILVISKLSLLFWRISSYLFCYLVFIY